MKANADLNRGVAAFEPWRLGSQCKLRFDAWSLSAAPEP
jgi:hypothetical protein